MITDRNIKIKKWLPELILHSTNPANHIANVSVGPTQLIHEGIAFSNLKTAKVLIGAVGVEDCDFNFATANNVTEQPIDLGAIVPAFARVIDVKTVTEAAFAAAATAIASWSVDTNVCTIITAANHGIVSTNSVVIAGMTETAINGTHTATRVDDTTFTIPLTHADATTTADATGTVVHTAMTLVAETGNATSGAQFIASATIKALNAITAANLTTMNVAPSAAASKVWVSATPESKWDHITTGQLAVYVSYLEI